MVSQAWKDGAGDTIQVRFDNVAGSLTSWAANTFGDVQKRIREAEKQLKKYEDEALMLIY